MCMAKYESIQERNGRVPDFRIKYRFLDSFPGRYRHQGIRTDFCYEGELDLISYMIYPEFESKAGEIIEETDDTLPSCGTARMWIINPEMMDAHSKRIIIGTKGHLVNGPMAVADVEVIETRWGKP